MLMPSSLYTRIGPVVAPATAVEVVAVAGIPSLALDAPADDVPAEGTLAESAGVVPGCKGLKSGPTGAPGGWPAKGEYGLWCVSVSKKKSQSAQRHCATRTSVRHARKWRRKRHARRHGRPLLWRGSRRIAIERRGVRQHSGRQWRRWKLIVLYALWCWLS